MPQIEGLKEQQDALKRVRNNLKEIEAINNFLKSVSALKDAEDAKVSYSVSVSVGAGEGSKRYKAPIQVSDNKYILNAALQHKQSIVATVKKDAADYRIGLSPKETAVLDWAPVLD